MHELVPWKNLKKSFSATPRTLKIVLSPKAAAQFSDFHPISTELQKSTKNCLKSCLRATKISVKIQAYFENPFAELLGGRGGTPPILPGRARTHKQEAQIQD